LVLSSPTLMIHRHMNLKFTLCSCPILMKLEFSRQSLEKYSNIKFHEIPSSGSRVVPLGQTDRRTDTAKLIVAFSNFANEHKNFFNIMSFLMRRA
jgi:hypothetical protein